MPRIFYRFATFEIPEIKWSNNIEDIMKQCYATPNKVLCNPGCFSNNLSPITIGQKSGDIMLLDRISWLKIRGWPEYECFVHVDTAVCFVASNNFDVHVPQDISICTYTMQQNQRDRPDRFVIIKDRNIFMNYDEYQTQRCLYYRDKLMSNESF
jgi:hypothetical protein